jgi:hypothetical protein
VHLPRKADAGNGIGAFARRLNRFPDRQGCCAPPIPWVLFRPARMRTRERRVLFYTRGTDAPRFIQDQRTRPAGSHIDAQGSDKASSLLWDCLPDGEALAKPC